jgi:hypothetical protein
MSSDDSIDAKINCANCLHCVLFKSQTGVDSQYVLRVRCTQKQWKKKLGEEKVYKYFTVARRTVDECEQYESMGDMKSYLKDLRKSLPIKDEIYKV